MTLPVIPTDNNGTTYIAVIFVFLAYGLHPTVEKAFSKLRAYRASQNIEKGESIEVTEVSAFAEIVRGRGSWDAARATALLVGAFSLASWVLELLLGIVNVTDGPVDMMDRPPPVMRPHHTSHWWEVRDDLDFHGSDKGFLDNFQGTLEEGSAKTRFRVGSVEYKGSTLAAWWSSEYSAAHSALNYDIYGNGTAVLDSLNCTQQQSGGDIYIGADTEERWGTFAECGSGPAIVSSTRRASAPTIVLTSDTTGESYLVVEEESNYPGFMYSVWVPEDGIAAAAAAVSSDVTITHAFHVASKSRLVEAIVTGIVNGLATGGGCIDLLFQYSELNEEYLPQDGKMRASPFGEHPGSTSSVQDLSDVEPIERGVYMDELVSVCAIFILIVSALGVGSAACVRSLIGVDVYDRDELIKVALLQSQGQSQSAAKGRRNSPPLSAMRIFVRKDVSGKLEITVRHAAKHASSCCGSSPTVAAAERGEVGMVHDTGGDKTMRLAGVPVEASPTNTSFMPSQTSVLSSQISYLSSQGAVHPISTIDRTTSSRPPTRRDRPRSTKITASTRAHMPSTSITPVPAPTQNSWERGRAALKPRLAIQSVGAALDTSRDAKGTTPRRTPPNGQSRTQARKSKERNKSRSVAPEDPYFTRLHNANWRRGVVQTAGPRPRVFVASSQAPVQVSSRRKVVASLDKEAALGATFGRPPHSPLDRCMIPSC